MAETGVLVEAYGAVTRVDSLAAGCEDRSRARTEAISPSPTPAARYRSHSSTARMCPCRRSSEPLVPLRTASDADQGPADLGPERPERPAKRRPGPSASHRRPHLGLRRVELVEVGLHIRHGQWSGYRHLRGFAVEKAGRADQGDVEHAQPAPRMRWCSSSSRCRLPATARHPIAVGRSFNHSTLHLAGYLAGRRPRFPNVDPRPPRSPVLDKAWGIAWRTS